MVLRLRVNFALNQKRDIFISINLNKSQLLALINRLYSYRFTEVKSHGLRLYKLKTLTETDLKQLFLTIGMKLCLTYLK